MMNLSRLLELAGFNREPLLEAVIDRYRQIFASMPERGKAPAEEAIQWAMKTLKREDRIIWWLRYFRIGLVMEISRSATEDNEKTRLRQLYEKLVTDLAKKSKLTAGDIRESVVFASSNAFKNKVSHSLSMEDLVHGIKKYQFAYQSPAQVIDDLAQAEDEWKIEQKTAFLPKTDEDKQYDAKLVIQFEDGFAWWNLNTESCSREGRAMGHCGNTATPKYGDRVLSLRKRGERGDMPYLTFILDQNGKLGEMKGRANKKPQPRYHKYIVPLLLHSEVVGIKGGGYAPHENFSLNDLPDDVREKVIEQKPELVRGSTLKEMIEMLEEEGMSITQADDGYTIWEGVWNDLPDSDTKSILESMYEIDDEVSPKTVLEDALEELQPEEIAALAKYADVEPWTENDDDVLRFVEDVLGSEDGNKLITTIISKLSAPFSKAEIDAFVKDACYDLFRTHYLESAEGLWIVPPDKPYEGTWEVRITENDIRNLVANLNDDDGYDVAVLRRGSPFDDGTEVDYDIKKGYLTHGDDILNTRMYSFLKKMLNAGKSSVPNDETAFAAALARYLSRSPLPRPKGIDDMFDKKFST